MDDRRFGLVDPPAAPERLAARIMLQRDSVAVAAPAAGAALAHAALEAATYLLSEILQEERVHRALQAHMQLADLTFANRDELHAGEGQLLIEGGYVLLVAGETVERLGDDDVELTPACIIEQALIAPAQPAGTALGTVGVGGGQGPAFGRDPRLAEAQLVLDRGITLEVGGITGVDDGAHDRPLLNR